MPRISILRSFFAFLRQKSPSRSFATLALCSSLYDVTIIIHRDLKMGIFFAVFKGRCSGILGGDKRVDANLDGPLDGKVGIIPAESALCIRAIRGSDLVVKVGHIAQHKEAVGAAGWNPKPIVGFVVEHITIPHPISRRALAKIDEHIEDRARSDPDEFALRRIARLVVQAAKDMPGGTAVIVLDKIEVEACLAESLAVPAFHEKAARIAKNSGF